MLIFIASATHCNEQDKFLKVFFWYSFSKQLFKNNDQLRKTRLLHNLTLMKVTEQALTKEVINENTSIFADT